ncbi:hypothetical protein NBRC110019_17350 [Neptunitalea chrysea]|uniref:Lipoprotein n=1 Tax=Neptunitalea chrysea TaxID=1647581 RepID=A0A9W6B6Y2_9FLAO|nr:hypothetical protein [Neptunitalea chrysea]GLB52695.1 hypothetical protein NBRC110019_17350 [Neptunitalea chrysea]
MNRKTFILAALLTGLVSCNAQQKNESTTNPTTAENTTKQETPKGNWTVNKEFDENGNLTSYDSIYTYGYSSDGNDTLPFNNKEEVMKHFQQYFGNTQMPSQFMNQFFSDSLGVNENFFDKNFFSNRMFSDDFQKQIQQMDSLRNSYLQQYQSQIWDNKKQNSKTTNKKNKA